MTFELNSMKVLRFFAPFWILVALSLWLNWEEWRAKPVLLAAVGGLPIWMSLASMFIGRRWRLELTPDALIHQTLARTERYEWARMGPLQMASAPIRDLFFIRTFWFEYPLDEPRTLEERALKLTGRRLLCVFGDKSAKDTIKEIEEIRALYTKRGG